MPPGRYLEEGGGRRAKKMKENLLFRSFPPWEDTKQTNRRIRMKPCVAAEAGSWGGGFVAGRELRRGSSGQAM